MRWRAATELYVVQEIVTAKKLPWEAWCQENINRSLGDIRKLLKMAASHDPEAAHEAEKAGQKAARGKKVNGADQRASMRALADTKRIAKIARQLISDHLACRSINETRTMLGSVELADLITALDEAEAASLTNVVPIHSTATH